MDAHLFRRFCDALVPRIMGARMEKIHAPGPGVTVFAMYGGDGREKKRYLALKADRRSPLLFSADHRIPVNAQPPAFVMRLRKHVSGRRIVRAVCEWTERRLFLGLSGDVSEWLCLDLREGPSLSFDAPAPENEPLWPEGGLSALSPDRWKTWQVLTPALRRTLVFLDPLDADALLMDLEAGGGDVFLYESDQGRCEVSAWPLPGEQLASMGGTWKETVFEDPVAALAKAGETLVYGEMAEHARQAAAKPFSAEASRLGKLLAKLDGEEKRLAAMRDRQKDALLLQSQLYLFSQNDKLDAVTLEGAEGPVTLKLDKKLTVRENMAALFHQAGRGKRGLEHLERRRAEVRAQKEAAEASMLRMLAAVNGAGAVPAAREKKRETKAASLPATLPKQVQAFRSSDGFLMLRGRDTRGNALALKLAAPHDYWLHTADGPSAHVIIRRDHAGQNVPERTLHEAGMLAALKSWQKDAESASIQYSLAKYIHPMKNAAPGMVRIDRSEGSFRVKLERDLEERLEKN
ncbi:NFACT RNA binding domain-containing protein [uncultured Mailhella sp.]|uniref:NFACT RNA binding domain-containing protein n=1 Tax=uncultured Mailhella sp. TaxID=1981031 RepID=UPI0025F696BB|nr:NFACT RNA binding domain-containing protein [uncultured Mailhella sp.]